MSSMRTMLATWGLLGTAGIGYGMWVAFSPGEGRKQEILKNLPEANPVRMEESRKRNMLIMQVLKEAAETKDNIARGIGYVFHAARGVMRRGGQTSMGTVAQIAFAACLAAWGCVVLADPVGKSHRKE
ncbi:hypothetical protein AAFF_G00200340 [Aldrovandia affinis]|uniref:Ubiquinol-cytochrome-c reductase complex assembly factor 3 n=1 Tax=Aldrovandia affinis TaxID=143900 RepID=A0AAD7W5K2_9TELE|nr:hypothetical protein AAFF_G00200340 [Aldrovandia affinis]